MQKLTKKQIELLKAEYDLLVAEYNNGDFVPFPLLKQYRLNHLTALLRANGVKI
jgi:hypothetical protein